MARTDQEKILLWLFAALSVLTSFAAIFYGIGVVTGPNQAKGLAVFAYVTIAYGMGNLSVLSLAWTTREKWAIAVIRLLVLCYLGVFVMDALRSGFESVTQLAGIALVALLLGTNYLAVKKAVARN